MKTIIFLLVFSPMLLHAQISQLNADVLGTSDTTDGGSLQLATPSLNHFLRFNSGQQNDPRALLYFSKDDTLSIMSGTKDYLDLRKNINIYNALSAGSPTTFIGINTTQPMRELDIQSNHLDDGSEINIGNLGNDHFLRFFSGRETLFTFPAIYWNDGDSLSLGTNANGYTERMRISSEGNVGICDNQPVAKLSIFHNSTGPSAHIEVVEDDAVDFARIRLRNKSDANFWDIAGNISDQGLLNFFNTVGGDIMSLTVDGKVGIRTDNPQAKLHVVSNDADNAAQFDGKVDFIDPILLNGSGGTAGQVLTSNGSGDPTWSTPEAANPQIGFKAILKSDTLISSATDVTLADFEEIYDDGENFNASTGIFTAPDDGVYHFTCMYSWTIGGATQTDKPIFIRIHVNGTLEEQMVERVTVIALIHEDQHYSTDLKLTSGDQISFVAYQLGGTSMYVSAVGSPQDTKVSGFKIY